MAQLCCSSTGCCSSTCWQHSTWQGAAALIYQCLSARLSSAMHVRSVSAASTQQYSHTAAKPQSSQPPAPAQCLQHQCCSESYRPIAAPGSSSVLLLLAKPHGLSPTERLKLQPLLVLFDAYSNCCVNSGCRPSDLQVTNDCHPNCPCISVAAACSCSASWLQPAAAAAAAAGHGPHHSSTQLSPDRGTTAPPCIQYCRAAIVPLLAAAAPWAPYYSLSTTLLRIKPPCST
jgi:hypothetical protein